MDGQATSKGRTDIDYTVMVQWHILHACQGNNEKKPKKKKQCFIHYSDSELT